MVQQIEYNLNIQLNLDISVAPEYLVDELYFGSNIFCCKTLNLKW